ncbi:MAG: GNAT family N-acetyltransferase [bacterium]|nr:GNAT family N-acetyltransferase [bacterium]
MARKKLATLPVETVALEWAVEVFVRGFGYTRSLTYPYLVERMGPLWVMRDAPRKRGNYRREEWVACGGVAPEEIDRVARKHTRGRFAVCVICALGESQEPVRTEMKALGYRLGFTEPLMTHPLKRVPNLDSPAVIQRVLTVDLADRLAKAARSRQIFPEHFSKDALLRQYVALIDDELVGWVRSIVVKDATWCSNMFVLPEFRRKGIAKAMLCKMLRNDRAGGSKTAVLTASHTGALLYPVVGYKEVGTLLLFTPKKR